MIQGINQAFDKTATMLTKKAAPKAAEKLNKIKYVLPAIILPATIDKDCFVSKQNYDDNPIGCDAAATSWLC